MRQIGYVRRFNKCWNFCKRFFYPVFISVFICGIISHRYYSLALSKTSTSRTSPSENDRHHLPSTNRQGHPQEMHGTSMDTDYVNYSLKIHPSGAGGKTVVQLYFPSRNISNLSQAFYLHRHGDQRLSNPASINVCTSSIKKYRRGCKRILNPVFVNVFVIRINLPRHGCQKRSKPCAIWA